MVQVVAWLWEWGAIGLWAGEWADGWVQGRCSRLGGRLVVDGGGVVRRLGRLRGRKWVRGRWRLRGILQF